MCSTNNSKYYKANIFSNKNISTRSSSKQTFAPKIGTTTAHVCRFIYSNSTEIIIKKACSKVMKFAPAG